MDIKHAIFYIIGIKSNNMPILIIGINNILKFTIWRCILWLLSIYAYKDHGVFNWSCFHQKKLKFLFTACKFVTTCHDQNVIYDSTIWETKKKKTNKQKNKVIWWCGVLFHVILTLGPPIPMSLFLN
jgi:hypothetical protein